jgi:protein-L-isoaspartate O-methyltransferase
MGREEIAVADNEQFTYFDAQASWGVTKHMGGLNATARLAELCHISKDTRVLEVGCGVGLTACYLATHLGGHVLGLQPRRFAHQRILSQHHLCRPRCPVRAGSDRWPGAG